MPDVVFVKLYVGPDARPVVWAKFVNDDGTCPEPIIYYEQTGVIMRLVMVYLTENPSGLHSAWTANFTVHDEKVGGQRIGVLWIEFDPLKKKFRDAWDQFRNVLGHVLAGRRVVVNNGISRKDAVLPPPTLGSQLF